MKDITLFAIQNEKGEWFRKCGLYGSGISWTKDFSLARIYTKIRPARAVVSWWANHYGEFPTPKLIQFNINRLIVLDETERVNKQKTAKAIRAQKRIIQNKEYQTQQAKADLADAERRLMELTKK